MKKDDQFSIRVPGNITNRIDEAAKRSSKSRNEIINELLNMAVNQLPANEMFNQDASVHVTYRVLEEINSQGLGKKNSDRPSVQLVEAFHEGKDLGHFIYVEDGDTPHGHWIMLAEGDVYQYSPLEYAELMRGEK
ncbi:MAG: ribbon-helix-helix protein, CopG family [Planctomycetota bacterium]